MGEGSKEEIEKAKEPWANVRFLLNIASDGISNKTFLERIQLFGGKLNCCVSSSNSHLLIFLHLSAIDS